MMSAADRYRAQYEREAAETVASWHAPSISETAAMRANALDDILSAVWECERWERQERHIDNLVRYSR